MKNEMIKEAAILKDGKIYSGRRHHNIIQAMPPKFFVGNGSVQGFVTDDGRFVDREEAAKLALAAGQVAVGKATVQHIFDGRRLYSEDLY